MEEFKDYLCGVDSSTTNGVNRETGKNPEGKNRKQKADDDSWMMDAVESYT